MSRRSRLRLGMGGSSAIIIAALRALCQYYSVEIPPPLQAKLALETETKELGVPAGPQDRVIQVYEGLVYMDFAKDLMDSRGYGEYERLDPSLLPNVYLAYRTSLSEGTEVFHTNVRERWNAGDAAGSRRNGGMGDATPSEDARRCWRETWLHWAN